MGGMEAIVKAFTQTFVISKSENDPTNKGTITILPPTIYTVEYNNSSPGA